MRPSRARVRGARRGRAAAVLVGIVAFAGLVAAGSVGAMVEGDVGAPGVSSIVVAARSSGASLASSAGKTEGVLRVAPSGGGGDLTVYLALEGQTSGVAHVALRHGGDDGPVVLAVSVGATPATGAACTQVLGGDLAGEGTTSTSRAAELDAAALMVLEAACVQQSVGVVAVPLLVPSHLPPGRYSLCGAFETAGRWRRPLCRALELLPVRAFVLDLEGPVDFGGGLESGVRSSVEGDLVRGNGNGTIVNVGNVPFAVGVTFGRMRSTGPGPERTIAGEFDARVVSQEAATAGADGLVVAPGTTEVHTVLGGVCVQPGTAARVDIGLTPSGPLERGRYEGFVTFGAASSAGCVAPPFSWDLVIAPRSGPFGVASAVATAVPTPVATAVPSATPTAGPGPTSNAGTGAGTATPEPSASASPSPAVEGGSLATSTPVPPLASTVSPTPTPTPARSPTTSPVATPTASATPTATATPTSTPSPTPVVLPTATPSPAAVVVTPAPVAPPLPTAAPPVPTEESSGGGAA